MMFKIADKLSGIYVSSDGLSVRAGTDADGHPKWVIYAYGHEIDRFSSGAEGLPELLAWLDSQCAPEAKCNALTVRAEKAEASEQLAENHAKNKRDAFALLYRIALGAPSGVPDIKEKLVAIAEEYEKLRYEISGFLESIGED
jgi:hypothetical protein